MTKNFIRLILFFFSLLALPTFGLSVEPEQWVLRNVTVVAMDGQAPLADQDVIVRGERIAAIEPTGAPHTGLKVVDGDGAYVIPGLVDMHVHLGSPLMLAMWVSHGVTGIRVMSSQDYVRDLRNAVDQGDLFGPHVFLASPLIEGDPPLWPQSEPVTDPEQARRLVRQYADEGYQAIKIYDGLSEKVFAAITEEAAVHGLPVVGHMPDNIPLETLLASQPASLEHVGGYLPEWFTQGRDACELPAEELEQLARKLATHRTTLVPTVSLYHYRGDPSAREAVRAEPAFSHLPAGLTEHFWGNVTPEAGSDRARRSVCSLANSRALVAAYIAAGGKPLPGTDTPNPWLVPGLALHQELELLVELGMSPEAVLTSATLGAAEWFGQADERGSIAVGKFADLVLLEANPLEDIRHTRRIAGVALAGQWLSAEALEAKVSTAAQSSSESP